MSIEARRMRANFLLLLCAIIWGFAFVAQSVGAHIGAFTFTSTRFFIGALSLFPVIAWLDRRRGVDAAERAERWRAVVRPGLVCGFWLFGGSILQQIGIEQTTAGNAAFVTGLYVVLVPVFGLFLGHRTNSVTWVGAAFAVVGLYLLTVTEDLQVNPGDAITLGGTAFWAFHIMALAHYASRTDVLRLSVAQFLVTSVFSAVAAFGLDPAPFVGVPGEIGPVLYAGLISVGVAFTLQVVAQADAIPSHASMIMSLEAMFGAFGGWLILNEQMSTRALVGAGLMMTGILLAQIPPRGAREREMVPLPEAPSTALVDD
jgi:drug/metabolite transporter (DMT)-like permease